MTDALTYKKLREAGELAKAGRMKPDFSLFGAFTKVEEQDDGTLIVSGLASTETVDSDGEIIKADAIRKTIPQYMAWGAVREMHGATAAGTALSMRVNDEDQTEFEAHIVDEGSVKKIQTGVLKGFSVGGRVTDRDKANRKVITGINLIEVSVVDRPANPDCRLEIAKFDQSPLRKEMWDVGSLAQMLQSIGYMVQSLQCEAEREGDGSTIPQQLRDWLGTGAKILGDLTEEETQELLANVAGEDADTKAAKAFKSHLLKRWASINPNGPVAVSKEAGTMAEELYKAEKDACVKAFGAVKDAVSAHKTAADAVHGLKDGANKDTVKGAMKDLADAHKAVKDAMDAHKDACAKMTGAIGGDSGEKAAGADGLVKALQEQLASQGAQLTQLTEMISKLGSAPAASPAEIAALAVTQKREASPLEQPVQQQAVVVIDPKAPVQDQRLAATKAAMGKPMDEDTFMKSRGSIPLALAK